MTLLNAFIGRKFALYFVYVVVALDAISTIIGLKMGFSEANPVPAWLFSHFPPVIVMLIGSLVCIWAFAFLLSRGNTFLFLILGFTKLTAGVNNLRLILMMIV